VKLPCQPASPAVARTTIVWSEALARPSHWSRLVLLHSRRGIHAASAACIAVERVAAGLMADSVIDVTCCQQHCPYHRFFISDSFAIITQDFTYYISS
jgi:hypothetical protein